MDNKLKLLKMMINTTLDVLGDKRYTPLCYAFNDFQGKMQMEHEEYEAFIKSMRHEGLIEIDMHGWDTLDRAKIKASPVGMEYLSTHETKRKIGFQ